MEQLRHLWRERLTPQEHSGLVGTLSQNSQNFQSAYATPWESMVSALGHSFSRASVMPEKKLREAALRCVALWQRQTGGCGAGGGDDNLWEAVPKRLGGLGILGIVAKRLGICPKIGWEKVKFYIQTCPLSAAYILEQIPNFPKPFSLLQSP